MPVSPSGLPVRPIGGSPLYAHTPGAHRPGTFHLLADHLRATGDLARGFATPFGGGDVAALAGYTHDAGKASAEVQTRLRSLGTGAALLRPHERLGVKHKEEGAALSVLLTLTGRQAAAEIVCTANLGHHGGLPDYVGGDTLAPATVARTMSRDPHRFDQLVDVVCELVGIDLRALAATVEVPDQLVGTDPAAAFNRELFTRMCHSALVDADFLDTSAHFAGTGPVSTGPTLGMGALLETFSATYAQNFGSASPTAMNHVRRTLFEECRAAGREPAQVEPVIYRVRAETGSGKTLAAMAFALEHAVQVGRRRVIVAVPFTSITTQNAQTYRRMFADLGDEVVLEHHSAIAEGRHDAHWQQRAAQNWDAEVIMTTTVQLLESLFAARPGRTRKLHRIAGSVIVIDEVQSLPVHLLPPILRMFRELVTHYNVTLLLSSATQPSFWRLPVWDGMAYVDLPASTPSSRLSPAASPAARVVYEVRPDVSHGEIAAEVAGERQALCIVNTTAAAQAMHSAVSAGSQRPETVRHLSTRMCGLHRRAVLDEVQLRLAADEPVTLVSTQVVEAGVDIDFPVVYRETAPLPAIIQSAGRANREGRLPGPGRVVLFSGPDNRLPLSGEYTFGTGFVHENVVLPKATERMSDPTLLDEYYEGLYGALLPTGDHPREDPVDAGRRQRLFAQTAREFTMIDDNTESVVVTGYGTADEQERLADLLDRLDRQAPGTWSRHDRRVVESHSVSLYLTRTSSGRVPETVARASGLKVWAGEYDPALGVVYTTAPTVAIW